MPYVTPVTDRTFADLAAQNSKAFMNVADWDRIYGNSVIVHTLFESTFFPIEFNTIAAISITTQPSASMFNIMLANIERMRWWIVNYLSSASTLYYIKHDWRDGKDAQAFNFNDVNLWESTIDAMYTALGAFAAPTVSGDLELFGSSGYLELIGAGNLELIG